MFGVDQEPGQFNATDTSTSKPEKEFEVDVEETETEADQSESRDSEKSFFEKADQFVRAYDHWVAFGASAMIVTVESYRISKKIGGM